MDPCEPGDRWYEGTENPDPVGERLAGSDDSVDMVLADEVFADVERGGGKMR